MYHAGVGEKAAKTGSLPAQPGELTCLAFLYHKQGLCSKVSIEVLLTVILGVWGCICHYPLSTASQ